MRLLLIIAFYYQIKTPIGFWCRRRLNCKYLIQPSETLSFELIGTHKKCDMPILIVNVTPIFKVMCKN